ncbi:molecular chaperone DnaK [soil metagenome]
MPELIVGIDLGTTNSAIACLRDGAPQIIPIDGQSTMPSCVGISPAGDLLVGQPALNQLVAAPGSTVTSIKRKMGQDLKISLGEKEFSPEEISALILRELKTKAEASLGQPVTKAVITVPAFFDESQRQATKNAGVLAGLDVVRIINEPTAAALAYEAGQQGDERLLVYDLGGGTFDVSAVVVESGVVEVKSSHCDTHLGGDDFDALLVAHAVESFQDQHGIDLAADPGTSRRLQVALERAKRQLSDEPFTTIDEEYIHGDHHLQLEISRSDYEDMIAPLLEKTLTCISETLDDAGIVSSAIDKVMLVGGSTRTPMVHQLLRDRMHADPRFEVDPDLIVALGAAIQGGIIAGEKCRSILVDITPHTFGTDTIDDLGFMPQIIYVPLIKRNTPLPASRSEAFLTLHDNQKTVLVKAFQGESPIPAENVFLGEFTVDGLSRVPAGNTIVINFSLDLNGMLQVTATEKDTGLAKSVTLDTRDTRHQLDMDAARSNLLALTGEPTHPEISPGDDPDDHDDLLATAKNLKSRAQALLETGIDPDDASEIRALLDSATNAISQGDMASLSESNDALSDLVFYLED